MEYRFSEMVEKIYNLPLSDKMELKNLWNIILQKKNEMKYMSVSINQRKSINQMNFILLRTLII